MKLYNKYEFLFVSDEDEIKKKNKLNKDVLDFLEGYELNGKDQKISLISKCKFMVKYAERNI